MIRVFVLTLLLLPACCGDVFSADLKALQDKFYTGITDIIERNMEDPQKALKEVDKYFEDNQVLVTQIRSETEKAMAQSVPMMQKMMDQYKSMSEKELEALEKKSAGMEKRMQSQMSPAMLRYNKAIESFTMKYPQHAMELAGKLMQLMPDFGKQMPMNQGWQRE